MFNDIVLQEKVFICKSQNGNVPTFLYYSQDFVILFAFSSNIFIFAKNSYFKYSLSHRSVIISYQN